MLGFKQHREEVINETRVIKIYQMYPKLPNAHTRNKNDDGYLYPDYESFKKALKQYATKNKIDYDTLVTDYEAFKASMKDVIW